MTRASPDTNEQLSAWLDGEVDPAEAAELEAELARDPALRAELESLETVVRVLREQGPAQAPLGFHHRVMARIEEEHPEQGSWWAWLRRPFGVPLEGWAIGLAAAVALLLVLPSRRPPVEDVPAPEETSPAVVAMPSAEDEAPPPPDAGQAEPQPATKTDAAPPVRKGIDKITQQKKVLPAPTTEIIPGKVTTGEEQPGVIPTVQLPPEPPAPTPAQGTGDESTRYAYVVRAEDVKVKREVYSICSRHGDLVGKAPATMASSEERVLCDLPDGALTAFDRDLKASGLAVQPLGAGDLVRSEVRVEITIRLEGGAIPAADVPPNAARQSFDAAEDVLGE